MRGETHSHVPGPTIMESDRAITLYFEVAGRSVPSSSGVAT